MQETFLRPLIPTVKPPPDLVAIPDKYNHIPNLYRLAYEMHHLLIQG